MSAGGLGGAAIRAVQAVKAVAWIKKVELSTLPSEPEGGITISATVT